MAATMTKTAAQKIANKWIADRPKLWIDGSIERGVDEQVRVVRNYMQRNTMTVSGISAYIVNAWRMNKRTAEAFALLACYAR